MWHLYQQFSIANDSDSVQKRWKLLMQAHWEYTPGFCFVMREQLLNQLSEKPPKYSLIKKTMLSMIASTLTFKLITK